MSDVKSNIADPGPLGLAAFAATTFVLSVGNAGLIPKDAVPVVFMLAFWYGGIVQLIAGTLEMVKGNLFGATAFTSYGAFWMIFGSMEVLAGLKVISFGQSGGIAVGMFLLVFTIFSFYMWIGTFKLNNALLATFSLLMLAFAGLIVGAFFGNATAHMLGGYFGILTALAAWYTSAAGVLNTVFGKAVLPVGPRNDAPKATQGVKMSA